MDENEDNIVHFKNILRIKTETGTEEIHYPIFYEGLPDEYRILAEKTLGETTANREIGLQRLKEFMKEENLTATDDILLNVLRSCKYDLKKSEAKLRRFLRFRQNVIERVCRMDEDKLDFILDDTNFSILPCRDKDGRGVIVSKPTFSLDKYSLEDVEPVALAFMLYLLNFPMSVVCGMSYIAECKYDTMPNYYAILKSFRIYIMGAFDLPIRYGRGDIVNEISLIRIFYNAIRRILPRKFTERASFHGNSYKRLHSIYHPDMLPKELEGNMEPINNRHYKERLVNFIKTLKEEGKKRAFSDMN